LSFFAASLSNPATVFIGVHEAGSAADEGFVYFDFAPRPTHFQKRASLHGQPDSVKHEPCGLLSDAKSAGYFVGTDAILAVRNQPDSNKPLVEGERGILKDSPDLDGELFPSVWALAFPHPASRQESHIIPATSGALDAARPAPRNHEFQAVVGICEVEDGLLESFWFGAHGRSSLSKLCQKRLTESSILLPMQK
jgi:hypothetical protein